MTPGLGGGTGPTQFRSLDLTVRRRLDGMLHGEHAGLRLGPGSEAEELTRYSPGHDVRRIDWNVTARAGEPQVWLTRAEHELDTWLLLDRTPSMAFGTVGLEGQQEKSDLAATVAGAVGLLTDAPGNRLGVATVSASGLTWSRPLPGRVAAHRCTRLPEPERDGVSLVDLAEALRTLDARHRRPGLRVVVSDLLDPTGAYERPFSWEPALRRLAARHDVVVVEVLDPRELELPAVAQLVLVDPESGRQRDVFTGDRRTRDAYAEAAAAHRRSTADALRAVGAAHVQLRTDGDWVAELARFVRTRRRAPARRGGARRTISRSTR